MADKEDATRKDTATKDGAESTGGSQGDFRDEREDAFDAIVNKREKAREDGTLDSDMGTQYLEATPEEKEPEEKAEAKPAEDEKTQPVETQPEKKDDAEEMVEITVYGEKKKVPKSKAYEAGIRALQKESAADVKLEKADAILEEVKKLREDLEKPTQEPQPKPDAAEGMTNADLIYAIRYGEEDEAEQAIEALKGRGQSFKPEDIDRLIDERLMAQSEKEIMGRLNAPVEEGGYKDIMDNPRLRNYAGLKVEELVEEGKGSLDSFETYRDAAEWVRTAILGKAPSKQAPEDDEDPGKKKKRDKEKLTNISAATDTSAAESKLKTDQPADPESDRRAAIRKMQEDRNAGRFQ